MSINRATRNLVRKGAIIKARRLWIRAGWHPPSGDPRLKK